MKTKINKTIIEGRKFRRLIDRETNTCERISGWIVTDRPFKKATSLKIIKIQKEK